MNKTINEDEVSSSCSPSPSIPEDEIRTIWENRKQKINMRQFLINFCNNRSVNASWIEISRFMTYGNYSSWQCRWTRWQERFWNKLSEWLEGK